MIEQFEAGTLPNEAHWSAHIAQLRENTKACTKEDVKQALIHAIKKRIPPEPFGVLFSGGVDSSIIALILKQCTDNFTCYSVGTEGSADLVAAEKTAKALGVKWKQKTFAKEDIKTFFTRAKALYDKPDVVNVGVGSVIIAAAELAKEDGVTVLFGGLGSEEIFAGYQRHAKADNINEECWNGLVSTWERDFTRDAAIGKHLGINVLVPFLDDDLIMKAMGIPGEQKLNPEHRKIILREIAEELGLLKEIAWRKKLGAQYGSGFDKVMDKLAKEAGASKSVYVKQLL